MATVLSFGIYKVKMPARRVDAFDVFGQSEADQIAANIGVFKHRLVFCCVRKADPVFFLPGDRANHPDSTTSSPSGVSSPEAYSALKPIMMFDGNGHVCDPK